MRIAKRLATSKATGKKRKQSSTKSSRWKKKRVIFKVDSDLEDFLELKNPERISVWVDSDDDHSIPVAKVRCELLAGIKLFEDLTEADADFALC